MPLKISIVISKINGNTDWINKIPSEYNIIVYDKSPTGNIPNVGRDGHTIYKHIVDNYNNLDDYIIFLQDNTYANYPNLINKLKDIKQIIYSGQEIQYKFITDAEHEYTLERKVFGHSPYTTNEIYDKIFCDYENNFIPITKLYKLNPGAQFIVSKKQILKNPIDIYQNIVKMLEYSENPIEGHDILRLHTLIFSNRDGEYIKYSDCNGEKNVAKFPKVKVVVSKYKEDISWTKNIPKEFELVIYDKNQGGNLPNVGREGHTYYTHIVNNYDNLDDYIIFLQGHPFDHAPDLIYKLNEIKKRLQLGNKINYEFISNVEHNYLLERKALDHSRHTTIEIYNKLFKDTKYNFPCDKFYRFTPGAQFIVSKKSILKHPKSLYQKIIDILNYDSNPDEGHDIERLHTHVFSEINGKYMSL